MRGIATLCFLLVAVTAHAELPSASEAQIRTALTSGQPVVIDLGARTCASCKEMAPILEGLAAEYQGKAAVLFIDVRQDAAAAKKFGIQMIPTQIFFNAQGKEVKRHVGVMDKSGIIQELKAAGLQ